MSCEQEVLSKLAAIETIVGEVRDDVRQVKSTLYGNGRPGMRIELDRLSQTCERRRKEYEKHQGWLARGVITIVVAAVIAAAGVIWKIVMWAEHEI